MVANLSDKTDDSLVPDKASTENPVPAHLRILRTLRDQRIGLGGIIPSESQLSAALAVGRPQIREGLRVLEAFGAIDARQGARRVWRGFDGTTFGEQIGGVLGAGGSSALADFLELRQTLETTLLPQAVDKMTPLDLARLRDLAGRMISEAEAGRPFTREDEEFHRLMFAALGNTMLLGLMTAYWRVFHAYTAGRPADEDRLAVARKHLAIADAITDGDIRLAAHELDAHFYGVRRRVVSLRDHPEQEARPAG